LSKRFSMDWGSRMASMIASLYKYSSHDVGSKARIQKLN
jgi:hypothetical protein